MTKARAKRSANVRRRGRPRGGTLSQDDIVRAALRVVERRGPGALGINEVARQLGIQPASVYNHVEGVAALRALVVASGYRALLLELAPNESVASARQALEGVARAFRTFAKAHPALYALMTQEPLADGPQKEELRGLVFDSLGGALLQLRVPKEHLVDAIRSLRSAVFGFIALEANGELELGESPDASFDFMLETFLRGLEHKHCSIS
jgi:AcrR family transcriptional regulator